MKILQLFPKKMAATKREAQEGKIQAAKATTLANETKNQLEALEKRVTQLEKNPPPRPTPNQAPNAQGSPSSAAEGGRDWDQLGGEEGNTAIVGGFRMYSDRDEKQNEWNNVQEQLPPELTTAIQEIIVPASLGSIIIIKLTSKGNVKDTRVAMLAWTKKFKELKPTFQAEGETTPRTFYAAPSKPYAMRQRDARTNQIMDGLKLIAGADNEPKLRLDLSTGRILFERTLLVERPRNASEPTFHMEAMQRIFPDITKDKLEDKIKEAKHNRDMSRRPP